MFSYGLLDAMGYELLEDLDSFVGLVQYIKNNEYNNEYNSINSLPYLWENTDKKIKEVISSTKGCEDEFKEWFRDSVNKGYYREEDPYFEFTDYDDFVSWSYEDIKKIYSDNLVDITEYILKFIIKNTPKKLQKILSNYNK